jgi:hypothetical protein
MDLRSDIVPPRLGSRDESTAFIGLGERSFKKKLQHLQNKNRAYPNGANRQERYG